MFRVICPTCNGEGVSHNGYPDPCTTKAPCLTCFGAGWIEIKDTMLQWINSMAKAKQSHVDFKQDRDN